MNETEERLNDIRIENNIWILYLGIIALSYWANEFEKKYFIYNDQKAKENYRVLTIIIFSILVIVYYYFFREGLENVNGLGPWNDEKKKELTKLNAFASTLILVAGIIFLYIAIVDTELNVEIAFN